MKKIILIAFLISSICYSQTITKDNIEITIKKSKLVDNVSVFAVKQL